MVSGSAHRWNDFSKLHSVANTNGVRTIGELTVHRESMWRVLTENPESLKSILNALQEALQPVNTAAQDQFEMLLGALDWHRKLAGLILLAPDIAIILHGIRHLFCC
jgi:hypothetical protein